MVKLWHQDTWDLDAPVELWLDKDANLGDFANEISEKLKISTNSICCTKINSPWNFHRVELPYIEWIQLTQEDTSRNLMSSNPFYLSTDGILFMVKDSSVEGREMTAEEKDLYRCEDFEN